VRWALYCFFCVCRRAERQVKYDEIRRKYGTSPLTTLSPCSWYTVDNLSTVAQMRLFYCQWNANFWIVCCVILSTSEWNFKLCHFTCLRVSVVLRFTLMWCWSLCSFCNMCFTSVCWWSCCEMNVNFVSCLFQFCCRPYERRRRILIDALHSVRQRSLSCLPLDVSTDTATANALTVGSRKWEGVASFPSFPFCFPRRLVPFPPRKRFA